ncbi:hypothetical protein [Oceanobacillus jeddahense]|uniref:Uncharacterized protein n=1 Tax=Oceanobacillus jeddahense TaxID=1462527 RepID=A0ABY5JW43_9BACI|nr:hypothetical protein [Oceanobacillus jeddahense]UUI04607.1 hypothetical protein NP439_08115 [Oceanobacillus jeddahense]
MRGYGGIFVLSVVFGWRLPKEEVTPMDLESSLTLMISFGMLIAFIMADKNHKK